jgi:hypothetical protein
MTLAHYAEEKWIAVYDTIMTHPYWLHSALKRAGLEAVLMHAKSMGSQEGRALLVAHKHLLGRLIDVEMNIRGILRVRCRSTDNTQLLFRVQQGADKSRHG